LFVSTLHHQLSVTVATIFQTLKSQKMEQQFQSLKQQLDRIERASLGQKPVLNFEEFCLYTGISQSFAYKLTSGRCIPYSQPNGKKIYFDRLEVDKWLLKNPVKTTPQLKNEVRGGGAKC
jgi:excisionase family DNA binding protein